MHRDSIVAASPQVYNTILKVVFLSTSYATIYLIRNQYKHTYDKENDTFRMIFLVVPCFILACFINYYPNPQEVRTGRALACRWISVQNLSGTMSTVVA